jgi:hypothetical protein
MKNSKTLLLEYLASIRDPERAAETPEKTFAEYVASGESLDRVLHALCIDFDRDGVCAATISAETSQRRIARSMSYR